MSEGTGGAPALGRLTRRLSANASVQAAGLVAGSLVSLVTFALLARYLGPGTFGELAAATLFLSIPLRFIDSGLSLALLREISRAPARTGVAVRASLPLRLLIAVALLAAALTLAAVLPFSDGIESAVRIGAIGTLATLLGSGVVPVLQADLRMGWAVIADLAGRGITLGCASAAAALDLGLAGAAWAFAIGATATMIILLGTVARRISLRPLVDRRYWGSHIREAALLGVTTSIEQIIWRIDGLLVAVVRASREVGLYATATKFVDLTLAFINVVLNSAFPSFARFLSDGDPRFRPLVRKTLEILLAFTVPVSVVCLLFPEELVVLAGGEQFRDAADALRIMAILPASAAFSSLLERGLLAAGLERPLLKINVAVLALNVIPNLVVIPTFGFKGAALVALTTEAAWVVMAAIMFRRALHFLPDVRVMSSVGIAAAAMVVAVLINPAPAYASAACGLAAYAAVLCALPGAVRDLLRGVALHARRPREA